MAATFPSQAGKNLDLKISWKVSKTISISRYNMATLKQICFGRTLLKKTLSFYSETLKLICFGRSLMLLNFQNPTALGCTVWLHQVPKSSSSMLCQMAKDKIRPQSRAKINSTSGKVRQNTEMDKAVMTCSKWGMANKNIETKPKTIWIRNLRTKSLRWWAELTTSRSFKTSQKSSPLASTKNCQKITRPSS